MAAAIGAAAAAVGTILVEDVMDDINVMDTIVNVIEDDYGLGLDDRPGGGIGRLGQAGDMIQEIRQRKRQKRDPEQEHNNSGTMEKALGAIQNTAAKIANEVMAPGAQVDTKAHSGCSCAGGRKCYGGVKYTCEEKAKYKCAKMESCKGCSRYIKRRPYKRRTYRRRTTGRRYY